MARKTISSLTLALLSQEHRVVVADWRFHVLYCRVAREHSFKLPEAAQVNALIRKLLNAGDIEPMDSMRGVFLVTVPFASTLPVPDEAIIQEANPFAVFSNLTAAAYHELTHTIPPEIHVTNYQDNGVRQPLGTTPDDWLDVPRPVRRTPKTVHDTRVVWSATKPDWDFGHTIGHTQGCPFYITDLERTLLDSLRFPEKSGGIREVFHIWKQAADVLDLERLVGYVDRFNQALLRQRAGFLLEQLGVSHPTFDVWARRGVRGSSAKLAANREFCSEHSERWNLSINVPTSVLNELRGA